MIRPHMTSRLSFRRRDKSLFPDRSIGPEPFDIRKLVMREREDSASLRSESVAFTDGSAQPTANSEPGDPAQSTQADTSCADGNSKADTNESQATTEKGKSKVKNSIQTLFDYHERPLNETSSDNFSLCVTGAAYDPARVSVYRKDEYGFHLIPSVNGVQYKDPPANDLKYQDSVSVFDARDIPIFHIGGARSTSLLSSVTQTIQDVYVGERKETKFAIEEENFEGYLEKPDGLQGWDLHFVDKDSEVSTEAT